MNHSTRLTLPLLTMAAISANAAPVTAFPTHALGNTQIRDLPPAANGRQFRVMVGLPYSYAANPTKRYPVLYICDGYWDFSLVNGMYGNLLYDKVIPEFIIVGLSYPGENPNYDSLRRYDYTPVPDPSDPKGQNSGHAPEFLTALRSHIIPFVQAQYRVDSSYRVLGGSSLGGLFALYSLFQAPGLFQGVIAPSPAVVWANGWIFNREAEFAKTKTPLRSRLFLSTASEEWPDFTAAIRRFHDTLEIHRTPELSLKWRIVDGERHAGTKAESYSRGLRYVFAPLAPEPSEK